MTALVGENQVVRCPIGGSRLELLAAHLLALERFDRVAISGMERLPLRVLGSFSSTSPLTRVAALRIVACSPRSPGLHQPTAARLPRPAAPRFRARTSRQAHRGGLRSPARRSASLANPGLDPLHRSRPPRRPDIVKRVAIDQAATFGGLESQVEDVVCDIESLGRVAVCQVGIRTLDHHWCSNQLVQPFRAELAS